MPPTISGLLNTRAIMHAWWLLLLLLCASAALALPNPAEAVSNQGLVGYWSFNEGTGTKTTDFSGNGNTGTLSTSGGGIPTWTNGKRGKALDFDNSLAARVEVPTTPTLDLETALTISAWVKLDSLITDPIIFMRGDGAERWYFYLASTQRLTLGSLNGGDFSFGIDDNTTVPVGQWVHVVGVMDSTQSGSNRIKLYKNGVEITAKSVQWTNGFDSTDGTADIGSGVTLDKWDGQIDEVRIYNRALSAAEVLELYQTGAVLKRPPNNLGLVGYWSFNEGTSTKATDFSGNGNHANFPGGAAKPDWVTGKRGGGLSWGDPSNDEPIDAGIGSTLDIATGQMTMALWMKKIQGHIPVTKVLSESVLSLVAELTDGFLRPTTMMNSASSSWTTKRPLWVPVCR